MAAPKNAQSRGNKRIYTWRNEKYWSVTTILQAVPKHALKPWAVKVTAAGALADRDIVAVMLGKCPTPADCSDTARLLAKTSGQKAKQVEAEFCEHCYQALQYLKAPATSARDRAGGLGQTIHDATEAYILGKPFPKWNVLIAPRMKQFEKWLADYEPEFGATEVSVYNRSEHYAGTLDGFATIQGRTGIGDYKSGKGLYPEVALQLAAYRHAEFMGLPDGSEEPLPAVDFAWALRLADNDYQFEEVRADREVFNAFKYVREVFRWSEETSKSVLLGPVGSRIGDADLALAKSLAKDAA